MPSFPIMSKSSRDLSVDNTGEADLNMRRHTARTGIICLLIAGSRLILATDSSSVFVGAAVCSSCHESIHKEWSAGRHSRMIQPATSSSVLGDFGRGRITLRGARYCLRVENDAYYVTEPVLSGREQEHLVHYTLGSRRIQHYLTTLPDGKVPAMQPAVLNPYSRPMPPCRSDALYSGARNRGASDMSRGTASA
jgi:hypothetical protein